MFYPRTQDDIRYAELSWGRSFPCMGIGPGDLCHIAFPIGVHPAGQVWARSAQMFGVGMIWVGAGTRDTGLSLTRLTFQITHATDSDTNAERDYIIGELRKNRSIEAEQVYQAGQNLPTERVNHYITDGEITLAILAANCD